MPRSTIFHIRSSISHHSFRAANPGGELWFEAYGWISAFGFPKLMNMVRLSVISNKNKLIHVNMIAETTS